MINIYAQIFEKVSSYVAMAGLYGEEVANTFHDLICIDHYHKPFQSIAMQTGLAKGYKGKKAFEFGAKLLDQYKDYGTYEIKIMKSVSIKPSIWYEDHERMLLHRKAMEEHSECKEIHGKKDMLLGKYNYHNKHVNKEFLKKINAVAYELDTDVVFNFAGDNMPENYGEMVNEYLTKPIYFQWKYDARGRSYSGGYGINLQGNKTVRASLNFKNKEVINDPEPIYIAIANAMGYDKKTWAERIAYGKRCKPILNFKIPKGCESPEAYTKARRALHDWDNGIKSGFMMELDATASGLQIMAVLAKCKTTAKQVNLVKTGKREDIYDLVAHDMSHLVGYTIPRSTVKPPVMTHYYNSIENPKQAFSKEELEAFYKVLDGKLPAGELVMKYINTQWNPVAKAHEWVLPDYHTSFVKTMTRKKGTYTYQGKVMPYYYYINKGNLHDYRSLAPNIIHSIDGWIARQMVLRANFELVHVHDCFLFHPNHMKRVQQLYKEILCDLYDHFNLTDVIKSLTGFSKIRVNGDLTKKDIMDSEYALS